MVTTEPGSHYAERVEAKSREFGATNERVAAYLGWDTGSLTRYLNGTSRLSPVRAGVLEQFLGPNTESAVLAGVR